jgi:hypothetical protein
MLRIDRVETQMDLLPSPTAAATGASRAQEKPSAVLADPAARERLKVLVLEVLDEHLRELERRGAV